MKPRMRTFRGTTLAAKLGELAQEDARLYAQGRRFARDLLSDDDSASMVRSDVPAIVLGLPPGSKRLAWLKGYSAALNPFKGIRKDGVRARVYAQAWAGRVE